ncbi:hypothetical protein [Streptomyces sp. NBC_01304]|uniref:hypothetical protein n=1 Tax=Streptomyces sp. NBC_01304 TaxID=2903818 RepID=UPI002E113CE2|nr:hypothetical protein OG430_19695 [Streptomyces sp. NBC_01304]
MSVRKGLRAALALGLGLAALGACGIRATEVPTDFGAAPSRVPCITSTASVAAQSGRDGTPTQIFLVCGSQLVHVDRTVQLTPAQAGNRVKVAQSLLAELREEPAGAEQKAGFTSDVQGRTAIDGPGKDDPRTALRLSVPPEQLTPFALAQLVCTLGNSVAGTGEGKVVLGGPGEAPLRQYACTEAVRQRPGSAPAPTEPVG